VHKDPLDQLLLWRHGPVHKPILIRGARGVGKTTLVHEFARLAFSSLVTVNLLQQPEMAHLLLHSPLDLLSHVELHTGKQVIPGQTLLFIDELQAVPQVRGSLPLINELWPTLHLIASGAEIGPVAALSDWKRSDGVEQFFLGPVSFDNFLVFMGETRLQAFLGALLPGETVPDDLHKKLSQLLQTYQLVGGMPEAIATWLETGSYGQVEAVKKKIMATFMAELETQGRRHDASLLNELIAKIPKMVGEKLKYVKIDPNRRARDVTRGLKLLTLNGLAYQVRHSHANMVPLGVECNNRNFRALFLDVGLAATQLGIGTGRNHPDLPICLHQQLVGQHLLYAPSVRLKPRLYYWSRPKPTATAQVDYVFSLGRHILPVEVKSGKSGTLRAMHRFLAEKKSVLGLRFNSAPPSLTHEQGALAEGDWLDYKLLSLPYYMVGQVHRLCRTLFLQEEM